MRARSLVGLALALSVSACGPGSTSPPALAYRLPTPTEASYEVLDTASIAIEALGQSFELDVGSEAVYRLAFARAGDGVSVTLSVVDLAATVGVPFAAPIAVDESSISGDLVFTLDRRGDANLVSAPEVDQAVGQLVPPLQIAHSFFPALPGTAVRAGDTWADTISYEGDSDAGAGAQRSILQYTAVGDTVVGGTPLLAIAFTGTSEISNTLSMQGTEIQQSTSLEIEGRVLWDLQAGMMLERTTFSTGTGTVSVGLMPGELPTRFQAVSRVRLRRE